MGLKEVNKKTESFHKLVQEKKVKKASGKLFTGVDLGTSSIVISVIDEKGNFVAGESRPCKAIRDGIVVDYIGAVNVTRKIKEELEEKLGEKLTISASAMVPGGDSYTKEVITNVLEAAGLEVYKIYEEPEAAAHMLNIDSGAVVDIGGGTTGISVIKDKKVIDSCDEATGGHHMNLVISGALGLEYEEAEAKKIRDKKEVFQIIKPVAEKMANIVSNFLKGYKVEEIYLVGGSTDFEPMVNLFEKATGVPTIKPNHPIYITPMGIAVALLEDYYG